jgi:uncharacterized protein YbaP (TraB family)
VNKVKSFLVLFFKKELLVVLLFVCPAQAEPAIWLVQSPTAKVYLFGTMHVLPRKVDWFGPKVSAAFTDSSVLVEEADVSPGNSSAVQSMMAQAIAPDYDVWSKLNTTEAAKFRTQVSKCHLSDAVVAHFRPWFAAILPTMCVLLENGGSGFSIATASPEAALVARAQEAHKHLAYFETADEQIGYLSGAADSVQIKQLESAIDEGDRSEGDLDRMETAWLTGDVSATAKIVAEARAQGADFYDLMFTQRNKRFAAKIDEYLHGTKTVFIAIGAGHLAGPESVQAQLARLSYSSKRL